MSQIWKQIRIIEPFAIRACEVLRDLEKSQKIADVLSRREGFQERVSLINWVAVQCTPPQYAHMRAHGCAELREETSGR